MYHAGQDSYIICHNCKGWTCVSCDRSKPRPPPFPQFLLLTSQLTSIVVYHPSLTCAEATTANSKRAIENSLSQRFLRANCKKCPRCQAVGQKVSGCDHIKCPRCKHEYCWICLVDYKEIRRDGNERHLDDCPYRGGNLPDLEGDWRDEEDQSTNDEDSGDDEDDEDEDEDSEDEDDDEHNGEPSEEANRGLRRRLRGWLEER